MNSRGDSRLTSAVTSRGLSPRQPDARDVCLSFGIGEQIGYGAAGFVDVTSVLDPNYGKGREWVTHHNNRTSARPQRAGLPHRLALLAFSPFGRIYVVGPTHT